MFLIVLSVTHGGVIAFEVEGCIRNEKRKPKKATLWSNKKNMHLEIKGYIL